MSETSSICISSHLENSFDRHVEVGWEDWEEEREWGLDEIRFTSLQFVRLRWTLLELTRNHEKS